VASPFAQAVPQEPEKPVAKPDPVKEILDELVEAYGPSDAAIDKEICHALQREGLTAIRAARILEAIKSRRIPYIFKIVG
jgi:hypothetical protein